MVLPLGLDLHGRGRLWLQNGSKTTQEGHDGGQEFSREDILEDKVALEGKGRIWEKIVLTMLPPLVKVQGGIMMVFL